MHYLVTIGYETEQMDRNGNPRLQKLKYIVEAESVEEATIVASKYRAGDVRSSESISIVKLSGRYITDRQFPDKAIDVIDELGSEKRVSSNQVNTQMRKNGNSMILSQQPLNNGTGISLGGSRIIRMNGTTDYIDWTIFQGAGSSANGTLLQGTASGSGTWFSAFLITQ